MGLLWIMVELWWIMVGFVVDHGWGVVDHGWAGCGSWLGGVGSWLGVGGDHLSIRTLLRTYVRTYISERLQHAYVQRSADSSTCLRSVTSPFSVFENRLWRSSLPPHARPLKGPLDPARPSCARGSRCRGRTAVSSRRPGCVSAARVLEENHGWGLWIMVGFVVGHG